VIGDKFFSFNKNLTIFILLLNIAACSADPLAMLSLPFNEVEGGIPILYCIISLIQGILEPPPITSTDQSLVPLFFK